MQHRKYGIETKQSIKWLVKMYSNQTDIIIIGVIMFALLLWIVSLWYRAKYGANNCVTQLDPRQKRVIDELNLKAIELGYEIGSLTDKQMEELLHLCKYKAYKINPFFIAVEKTE